MSEELIEKVEHPKVIAKEIQGEMIDEIFLNKMPGDSTIVVMNSVMAAMDETESLQRAKKVMANRAAFL